MKNLRCTIVKIEIKKRRREQTKILKLIAYYGESCGVSKSI